MFNIKILVNKLNNMKNIISIVICLIGFSSTLYAQKRLSEVTIRNPYFEQIDIKELLDFDKYQEENFKNSRSTKTKLFVRENSPNAQYFRFKGTKDIIIISAILNDEAIKNWKEEEVKVGIATRNILGDSYIENLDFNNAKGTIQMFDEYLVHNNYLYYQNSKVNITLDITYISNESNENRLKNMRLILTELKVE